MDNITLRNLKICQHNIQSLKPKKALVQIFLYNNDIDILVLNETWLKSTDNIYIPGYRVLRKDSGNSYGGVAVFYKEYIKCHLISTPFTNNIQNIAFKVDTGKGFLTILGCYCPPRNNRFPINTLKI